MIKKLTIAILFFALNYVGEGQTSALDKNKPSSVRAKESTDKLNLLVESIGDLDKKITVCLYGNFNINDINAYNKRLALAEEYITQLDDIDKLFKGISEKNPTEKDYLLKQAYAKVIQLSIITRKSDYLDFLRIASMSKDAIVNEKYNPVSTFAQYEDKFNKWNTKSEKLIRDSRNLVKAYLERDKASIDALSLKAILLYYENKYDEAAKEFSTLINTTIPGTTEPALSDKYLGYLQTWLSQIYLQNNNIQECRKGLETVRILSEPEKSIFWAEMVLKCLKDKERKNHDIKIIGMEIPTNVNFYTWRKLLYTKEASSEFYMKEDQIKLSVNPQELFEMMGIGWEGLNRLEILPWYKAHTALTAITGRPYRNTDSFYINISNIKKKKLVKKQISLFRDRFDNSYRILNTFRYTRKSWSALINSNPGISFFRISRIKTNIALYYMSKNSETYLNVFNFMKIEKKRMDNTLLNSIEEEYKQSVENEIKQDIDFLEKNDPDNILFLLTKAETLSYMEEPGTALKQLEELGLRIKTGSTINNIDAKSYIELYKAYIYLRLGQIDYLKQSVQILEGYSHFDKYIRDFKKIIKFKDDEKIYKTN